MLTGLLREEGAAAGGVKRKKDQKGEKKREHAAPPLDRIPLPPLPSVQHLQQRSAQRESQKKTKINAENPPSVCLYSVLNSSGVCTAAFSETGENLAVGFRGSEIHVHALNQRVGFKKLKSAEELESLMQEHDDIPEELLYDEATKTDILQLSGHGPVHSVGFSCDKRLLLSGSADETVRLWNLDMRRTLVVYRVDSPAWDAQFCSRGLYFAVATASKLVSVYSTERVHPLRIFPDATEDVTCVDFHPNCNYVMGGSDDQKVRVWDVLNGECVMTLTGHRGVVHSVKVAPDGRTAVSASDDGMLALWDLGQQKMIAMQECGSMPFRVPIVYSPDSSVVAVGTPEHALTFFSIDTATVAFNYAHETRVNPDGFPLLSYPTKKTNLLDLHFARKNVIVGVGVYDQ